MPNQFSREDVQRHLYEIGDHARLHLRGGCQDARAWDYIIGHRDDPAFIDLLTVELADFDPTDYWSYNTPPVDGKVFGPRPYRPATAGDIDSALYHELEDKAVEVATELVERMWQNGPDLFTEALAMREEIDKLLNEVDRLLLARERIIKLHSNIPELCVVSSRDVSPTNRSPNAAQ